MRSEKKMGLDCLASKAVSLASLKKEGTQRDAAAACLVPARLRELSGSRLASGSLRGHYSTSSAG